MGSWGHIQRCLEPGPVCSEGISPVLLGDPMLFWGVMWGMEPVAAICKVNNCLYDPLALLPPPPPHFLMGASPLLQLGKVQTEKHGLGL